MNEPRSPFRPINENGESPFLDMDSEQVVRITKENRSNVVGDSIYVKVNGVDVYAPMDCAIVLHPYRNEMRIEHNKVLEDPKDRQYLILIKLLDYDTDEDGSNSYEIVQGRQDAFDFLANSEVIDFKESWILVDTVSMKDMVSCFDFMVQCIDNDLVENPDGFDPRDLPEYGGEE